MPETGKPFTALPVFLVRGFHHGAITRSAAGGHADRGIIIDGSGSGEQMACNKVRGIRAGVCHDLFTTQIARAHNDANVLIIGTKIVAPRWPR